MRAWTSLACITFLFICRVSAQLNINGVYSTTGTVGWSAISVDSLRAKTFHFIYPVFDCAPDTLYKQVIFSTRQKGENNEEVYFNKGGFLSIADSGDSLKWKNESALFDLALPGSNLLVSSESRTIKFNRDFGYDETRFNSKIIYTVPSGNLGFTYAKPGTSTLSCVDLMNGNTRWTANVPSREDWVDVTPLNDSVIIIAANGLHAVNINSGLLWSVPFQTAHTNTGTLVYSAAKHKSIQQLSTHIATSVDDNLITQLASNILIANQRIYIASKDGIMAFSFGGELKWKTDLSDYSPSKTFLIISDSTLLLVNFGIAKHGTNFVTHGLPFVLDITCARGEIVDQHNLGDIRNLADFMISKRGLSFGGKQTILEISGMGAEDVQTKIPLNITAYGQFVEFVDGDSYYVLKEGYFVPLNFIDDQLIYLKADNNKIYGVQSNKLVYEYHFSDLYRFDKRIGDRTILVGLTETIVTNKNFELLGTLKLASRNVALGNKLYFIDNEKVHIVNLNDIR
ncbi:MAG: hypothetical protein PSX36_13275 [bacterium]|nr:hypothetical protein [bacterium]